MKEINDKKGKASCSLLSTFYLSSTTNKFAVCMGIRLKEINDKKGKADCSLLSTFLFEQYRKQVCGMHGYKVERN